MLGATYRLAADNLAFNLSKSGKSSIKWRCVISEVLLYEGVVLSGYALILLGGVWCEGVRCCDYQ